MLLNLASIALATTLSPGASRTTMARADAVVDATIIDVEESQTADGLPIEIYRLDVAELMKGSMEGSVIDLKVPGG